MQEQISAAHQRIKDHVLRTPLFYSKYLSQLNEGKVYLKLESEQVTGSFKARGALNKVLKLSPEAKSRGLITASTGNHALGFARALEIAGATGTIYLPTNATASKVEALKQYKVNLEFYGSDVLTTELHAIHLAAESNSIYVSPYNDPFIIAGQGTLAVEVTEQLGHIDTVLGCIGGGGMMSGLSSWFAHASPETQIIGCLPENSPEMYLSVEAGHVVILDDPKDTLSDGSAGGLEEGAITFDICKKNITEYQLVSEDEIAQAIKWMVEKHHKIIEGAAGVALASFFKRANELKGKTVVIVICGANIATEKLIEILTTN